MDDKFINLVSRCREIRGWHTTGVLEGNFLKMKAREIQERLGIDAGTSMQIAERNTADEAMDYLIHEIAGL